MTNLEKYKNEIINYKNSEGQFCIDFVEPKILNPSGRLCSDTGCAHCYLLTTIWLKEEYKEPDVDWSKVPVDTKVYVRDDSCTEWYKRYFAKYENGLVYTWMYGQTSWISKEHETECWKYVKLAEDKNE